MIHQTHLRLALFAIAIGVVVVYPAAPDKLFSERADATSHFYGTIGRTLEVEMILTKHGAQIEGSYEYAAHRKAIPLKGRVLKPYKYELEETGPDGAVSGRFKINEAGELSTWETADHKRKLPVVLGEITPEQHQLLQKIWDTKPQITSLIAGFDHACVMRTIGVACWGDVPLMPGVAFGGPEMIAYRALPHLLMDDKVTAYATGSHRSCIVQSGAMRCWQPNDPTLMLREPTLVPGFDHGVTAIGSNDRYTCAVMSGALKCWDGSSLSAGSITEIISSGVSALSSGDPQCAVMYGGGLKCWSMEYDQQEKHPKLAVQDIAGLKGELRSLSATGLDQQHFACAVDAEGLKCWGNNYGGILDARTGHPVRNLPPAPIAGLETGVTSVATELSHICVIKEGKVFCWGGLNSVGELGNGTSNYVQGLVQVNGIDNATQVAVGPRYGCALTSSSHILCWGDNEFGQTGNASHDICSEPQRYGDPIKTPCNLHPVRVRGLD